VAVNLQDLRLILRLVAGMLLGDPLLAQALLNVTIVYTSSQQMDWLDILAASLNVLPALAAASSAPGTQLQPGYCSSHRLCSFITNRTQQLVLTSQAQTS